MTNSIHATALDRIAFAGLSLSVCYRPTVGDVRRHGACRQGYLRYGMVNLAKRHAETQRANTMFTIY